MICIVYPERTRDSISVPAGEKSRGDSNQEVKDRYSNSQDESSGIHDEDQENPNTPAQNGMGVYVPGVTEESDEKKFSGSVRVERASNQEVGNGDTVGSLGPYWW